LRSATDETDDDGAAYFDADCHRRGPSPHTTTPFPCERLGSLDSGASKAYAHVWVFCAGNGFGCGCGCGDGCSSFGNAGGFFFFFFL